MDTLGTLGHHEFALGFCGLVVEISGVRKSEFNLIVGSHFMAYLISKYLMYLEALLVKACGGRLFYNAMHIPCTDGEFGSATNRPISLWRIVIITLARLACVLYGLHRSL